MLPIAVLPDCVCRQVQEFFGVTGTLGGDQDRDFLTGLFDVGSAETRETLLWEGISRRPGADQSFFVFLSNLSP